MKYLVVKCDDSCDSVIDKEPICITDDMSKYGASYEIYEIQSNGKLKLIKDYDKAVEEGSALYKWVGDADESNPIPNKVITKWKNKKIKNFSKNEIEKIIKQVKFTENIDDIMIEIKTCGCYGEMIDGEWVVLGEYKDDIYDLGY